MKRILGTIALTAAVAVPAPGVYTLTPTAWSAARSVANEGHTHGATPSLWSGRGGVALAQPMAAVSRPDDRPCWSPWLSSYLRDGDTRPIKKMLRCAVRRYEVPGGIDKALAVVECESSFDPFALNDTGHIGLFQHNKKFWADRWRRWGIDLGVPRNPTNAWSAIMVSIRIVNRYGWSAWSCS